VNNAIENGDRHLQEKTKTTENIMDQITMETPNPKYRLYWCLIEFKD